jgi:hypothetical protein
MHSPCLLVGQQHDRQPRALVDDDVGDGGSWAFGGEDAGNVAGPVKARVHGKGTTGGGVAAAAAAGAGACVWMRLRARWQQALPREVARLCAPARLSASTRPASEGSRRRC